jgi:pyruvate formate lyase activating enzyme
VLALDEVAKCPLYHFETKGKAFSIATAGCNLKCLYCQNWTFSQVGPDEAPKTYELTPQAVVAKAIQHGAGAVSFFYTEPVVYYEYTLDIARQARARGLKTIMVTAGYVNPEPLRQLLPHLDAVVLGLKGWNEDYYRNYIGGELEHVKESIRILAASNGVWWEVATLIVPGLNDSMQEIAQMSAWLRATAGEERPIHFTRFRPEFQLKRLPMTPAATLTQARATAIQQGLKYVYVGNLPGHEGANTYCPACDAMAVERLGFTVLNKRIRAGACAACGYRIGGIWT